MLNIVNVGYDSTNYYVIEGGRGRLLVDVGFPGTMPKLRHALKRAGVELAAIGHLLCTHYHPDHAGLAQELKRAGLRLIVVEQQLPAIPELRRHMKPQYGYQEIALGDNLVVAAEQSRALLRGLGIDGQIIATPGHSDDSVTLILDTGQAFVGDLHPPHMAGDDGGKTEASWTAIRAAGAHTIYPGHAPVFRLD